MFDENMTSTQAMCEFFNYAEAHQREDITDVVHEYQKVIKKIVLREKQDGNNRLTSYPLD